MDHEKKRKFYYGWVIIAVCFISTFLTLGLINGTNSLYMIPVTSTLGISRSAFSMTFSLRFATQAVLNLFLGFFIRKLGARLMMSIGMLALGGAFICFSAAKSIVVFYAGGILLGFGLGWTSTTICASMIYTWFHKHIGTLTGIVMAGNGIGGALSSMLVGGWIADLGWRVSYMRTSYIALACIIPMYLLIRNKPEDLGLLPYGSDETKKLEMDKTKHIHGSSKGLTLRESAKRPCFYMALMCTFFVGFILNSVYQSTAPRVQDMGLGAEFSAITLSIFMVTLAFSKFLIGFLTDHIGYKRSYVLCLILAVAACMLFATFSSRPMAVVFAVVLGICMPVVTVMLPLTVSYLFGRENHSAILGIFAACSSAGIAVGNPIFSLAYDLLGDYFYAAWAYAGLLMLIILCMVMVFRASDRDQKCG